MPEYRGTGIGIRSATVVDENAVRALYLRAFPPEEARQVAALALALLHGEATHSGFAMVAEVAGHLVGHVAFSPLRLRGDTEWAGFILAPLAVLPEQQGCGVGAALVLEGLARVRTTDATACFVYGDPAYYGRFGFRAEAAAHHRPPHDLSFPSGWQGLSLTATGDMGRPGTLSCVEMLDDASLW